MRKLTIAGWACRLMFVLCGAALAVPTIAVHEASAARGSYQIKGQWYSPLGSASGYDETGTASFYGGNFHGRKTANGERYDQWGMTAAHKTLPMGTMVYVTNTKTGKTVKVRINDRGPFVGGRIIDLSTGVADVLGIRSSGLGQVRVRVAGGSDEGSSRKKRRA